MAEVRRLNQTLGIPLSSTSSAALHDFGTTLTRRLNQSRASAVLQSNLIAIKFGMAEAWRLNWASLYLPLYIPENLNNHFPITVQIAGYLANYLTDLSF